MEYNLVAKAPFRWRDVHTHLDDVAYYTVRVQSMQSLIRVAAFTFSIVILFVAMIKRKKKGIMKKREKKKTHTVL